VKAQGRLTTFFPGMIKGKKNSKQKRKGPGGTFLKGVPERRFVNSRGEKKRWGGTFSKNAKPKKRAKNVCSMGENGRNRLESLKKKNGWGGGREKIEKAENQGKNGK